jgi:hypothetical protein
MRLVKEHGDDADQAYGRRLGCFAGAAEVVATEPLEETLRARPNFRKGYCLENSVLPFQ